VSVGERPELDNQEKSPGGGRGNGKTSGGSARGKRGRPRRAAASAIAEDAGALDERPERGGVATAGGGDGAVTGGSATQRERAMRRLLAGLRAVESDRIACVERGGRGQGGGTRLVTGVFVEITAQPRDPQRQVRLMMRIASQYFLVAQLGAKMVGFCSWEKEHSYP